MKPLLLVNNYYKSCKGIEINPNSINIANYNKLNNSIKNCEFLCGMVENIIDDINLDNLVIFINPPRRGIYENVVHKLNSIKKKILFMLNFIGYDISLAKKNRVYFNQLIEAYSNHFKIYKNHYYNKKKIFIVIELHFLNIILTKNQK